MMIFCRNGYRALILTVIAALLQPSCSNKPGQPGRTTISGSFPQFKNKQITLSKIDIRSALPVDTTVMDKNGNFHFRFDRDSAGMYLVKVDNRNYITLVLDREKKVSLYSESNLIRANYAVEGSEDSRRLMRFESFLEKKKNMVDSLAVAFNKGQSSPGLTLLQQQMNEEYQAVFDQVRDTSKVFLEENCGSLACLLVLNRRFGQRKIMTEEEDSRYFIMIDSCLSLKYPGNRHLLEHKKRVEVLRQQKAVRDHWDQLLAIGKKAPDITLEDPSGKSLALHSLAGKPVIVYFWASWDKNSRRVNKEMARLFESNQVTGLQVYAIGVESYRDPWVGAIAADGLNWINVTDYLNLQSGSLSLFNVPKTLPYFYLLNEELAIRYKGNDINDLLAELSK